MDKPFKVGDIVVQRSGSVRMKVSAIDRSDGRVRCTWVRGPAKHSQSFAATELMSVIRPG
ncbi:hypothetical protein [Solimonas soli]|uniref:hypothetical protein n=1 Tax=Solimonas soli TaxID=413479 RepID=UPI0004807C1E|nr:hypothetical protein [Solimonas soli]